MIFDDVIILSKKKHISKMDMCRFLAQVPDTTLSAGCETNADAIAKFYTDDDIKELFKYWFGLYKSMARDRKLLWKDDDERTLEDNS